MPCYKKLVDSIVPSDSAYGLLRSNMDNLTFFTTKSHEKLDRIAYYLAQRLNRDVSRQKHTVVCVNGGIGHSAGDLICSVSRPLGGKLSQDGSE